MIPYIKNKNCPCVRCRAHGMMGAAVLITLGVLSFWKATESFRFIEACARAACW